MEIVRGFGQDKKDDRAVGIKSTALHFGDRTKAWLSGFAAANIGFLALTGAAADMGWPYGVGVGLAGAHLAWQICTVDIDSPRDCMQKFVSNKWFGGILFGGIVADKLLA